MKMKQYNILALVLVMLCASLYADSATWNYRSGVGTSPANPTLWSDSGNWQGSTPPSGTTAIATLDASESHASEVVWVKLPDDDFVTLGGMTQTANAPQFRFIGGKGFYFINTSNGSLLTANAANRSIVYSPVKVKYYLELRGIGLACPLMFEQIGAQQLSFYSSPSASFYCRYYAPCGGETRAMCPGLEWLWVRGVASTGTFVMPNNNETHTGSWVATEGSKLLKWVSGTKGLSLAVGQFVHATGVIPEGAYVERLYTDDYVEISEPALASSADATAGTAVSFDRCYYKLTQHLSQLQAFGGDNNLGVQRDTAENIAAFDIDKITGGSSYGVYFSYPGHVYYGETEGKIDAYPQPATVRIADTSELRGYIGVRSGYVCVTSTVPGKADIAQLKFYDSASYRQYGRCVFETPAGVTSTVASCVNQWYGTIGKKGAGEMSVTTSIATHYRLRVYEGLFTLNPTAENSTMDKITVKDGGTFRLAPDCSLSVSTLVVEAGGRICLAAGATLPAPTTLTFAAGGIIRVEEGATFDASTWNIPDGTVFEGSGTVTGLTTAKIKACVFRDGVSVPLAGSADNIMMTGTTEASLPARISPAFWVSAKSADSLVKGDSSHANLITQWNDCRGTPEQGYHFATNAMPGGFPASTAYYPALANNLVKMPRTDGVTVTSPCDTPALVWDRPISRIKAVFAIVNGAYDNQNGGGSILGSTERLGTCDFYRSGVRSWFNDRFSSGASSNVLNAPYYVNGHLPPDGETLGGSLRAKPMLVGCFPQLVEVHPLDEGAEADCWGYQNAGKGNFGAWIGECIIYTNAVTEIERRQIENYLMQKWFGGCVVGAEIVPEDQSFTDETVGGANVNVAAGDAILITSITNATGLVKSGAGTTYLKGLRTSGDLQVQGGTVHVASYDATDASILPEGALLHVDANDDDSFPNATEVDGGQGVPRWNDTDNPSGQLFLQRANGSYGMPIRRTDSTSFAQPMKVVDYGAFHNYLDDDWMVKDGSGWYGTAANSIFHCLTQGATATNATGITSVFAVWGTAAGGNQLLGGYNQTAGLQREYVASSDVAANIAKPIMVGQATHRNTTQSDIGYESLAFLNGGKVVPVDAAPSGAYDVVSILSPYTMSCASIGCRGIRTTSGGLQMGELILYTKMLTADEAKRVDAYLNYKWFGRTPGAAFLPAQVGVLDVAEGATVVVDGNAPIVCSSLSGAGTVSGSVALAEDAVIEVPVNADGTVTGALTVSGDVDMSKGGVVRLTLHGSPLADGEWLLVSSSAVDLGGTWTIEGYTGTKVIHLSRRADGLWLSVKDRALIIIVR